VISFIVYGQPVAQGRPKASTRGGFVKMYDPEKSRNYKEFVYSEAVKVKPAVPAEGEIMAEITAYFEIPKSKSNKFREQALDGNINPTKKPDADNIAKIILDSCNGILYKDDSQVVNLVVRKEYSVQPRVEVELWGCD
jgi:Holliday junction resolvase RusA-like endonuclease